MMTSSGLDYRYRRAAAADAGKAGIGGDGYSGSELTAKG
jgi:hypothetical protein